MAEIKASIEIERRILQKEKKVCHVTVTGQDINDGLIVIKNDVHINKNWNRNKKWSTSYQGHCQDGASKA